MLVDKKVPSPLSFESSKNSFGNDVCVSQRTTWFDIFVPEQHSILIEEVPHHDDVTVDIGHKLPMLSLPFLRKATLFHSFSVLAVEVEPFDNKANTRLVGDINAFVRSSADKAEASFIM